jgi:hypothetical protein
LHRTAQNIAAQTVRTEVRRRAREQEALAMNELLANESDVAWKNIAPHLDTALGELSEPDRDALLLRYFERKSAREMAQTLGTTEEAAQKRVNRAVERLRDFFSKRNVTVGASGLAVLISTNAVQAAPVGMFATISSAVSLAGIAVQTSTAIAATKTIAMTTLQKTLIATALVVATGTGIYEVREASNLRKKIQSLQEGQLLLTEQIQRLQNEREDFARQLAALRDENERLNSNTSELLKLRSEVTGLRNESRRLTRENTGDANDPALGVAQDWLKRAKLLKDRFEDWPGKKTPELQLLDVQDWLNEVADHELDSDAACRESMSRLRYAAKSKFASSVNQALEEFFKSNNERLPSDLSQLMPYLKPPMDSFLAGYEIAKPGSVRPPQPNSPDSKRAETWALVERESFTPDGIAIRSGSSLADPDHDMHIVIYRGGHYGYGTGKPSK